MKVIDFSAQKGGIKKEGAFRRILSRVQQRILPTAPIPQEHLIRVFQKLLDKRFTLLCNFPLEGLGHPIPLILVGPTGLWVIHISTKKGIFRAREDVWEELKNHTKDYKVSLPNPVAVSSAQAQAVASFLDKSGVSHPPVEPVVFFSHPGTHVESMHPKARLILADGLERFCVTALHSQVAIETQDVQRIVEALIGGEQIAGGDQSIEEIRDIYSLQELPPEKPIRLPTPRINVPADEPSFVKKVSLTPRQWKLIGIMLLINIILLIALVLVIYFSA